MDIKLRWASYLLMLGFVLGAAALSPWPANADELPNACPVDGCEITITDVQKDGDELRLTLEANFGPDVSKNHIHVWWGDLYSVEQAGRSAETVHGVEQGVWHRHDDYPTYVTTEGASTSVREGTTRLCAAAADRDHNIIETELHHCVDVSSFL
ncbi:MAG: hypothetical protein AAGB11_11335 [Pseudomonadota bacterium]